jgi:hypothetical protein
MAKPYAIHCPKCGSEMFEHSLSYLDEGTLAEGTDECPNCGLMREYLYGHWRETEREEADPMATNLVGMYDHLNKGDHWQLNLSITTVAELVRKMNFGEHRFLSELIRQRKADPLYKGDSEFKLNTDKLEQLINEGYY